MSLPPGKTGTVIDRFFSDGQWFYRVRFEDGSDAVVPERKLKKT